jgi:predicted nucleotidyltransferase
MKKLYLEPIYLKLIKGILKKNVPSRNVLAFGSRVTGSHKPHSDLDICILGGIPLTLLEMANLREEFSESALPIRIDIVDWATITKEFKNIIEKNQVMIQKA